MVFGTLKFRNIPWNISVLQRCVRASDGIFYSNSIQNGSYGMLKVEYSRNIPGNIDGSFGICKGEYGHSPTGILGKGQDQLCRWRGDKEAQPA